tara:strand:+ start:14490 stop:16658 length:2169 start_codon:yes stop_codon:yes gene_type:complete
MSEQFLSKQCQALAKQMFEVMSKVDNVDPAAVDAVVKKFIDVGLTQKKPNGWQIFNEYTINSMLSGSGTPLINALGGAINALAKPTLEVISTSFGGDKLAQREARAMFDSIFDGLKSDLVFLNKGVRTGLPIDFQLTPKALGMTQKEFNIKMEAAGARVDPITGDVSDVDANRFLAESYDYMTKAIPGKLGEVIRFPTRLTVGVDEYFKARLRSQKTMALVSRKASLDEAAGKGKYETLYQQYKERAFSTIPRAEIEAKATRDLPALKKSDPKISYESLVKRYTEEDQIDYVGRLDAVFGRDDSFETAIYDVRNYATDGTFQMKLTGSLAKISEFRGQGSTGAETAMIQVVPFLRTPWNLTKEGLSYVPGVGILINPGRTKTNLTYALIDGVEVPKFKTEVIKMSKEEIAARQVVGLGVVAGLGALYSADRLTGSPPADAAGRASWDANGTKPYSIKVLDQWVSYQRVEPLATVMGLAADTFALTDRYMSGKMQPGKEYEEVLEASWSLLKANVLEKTFLQGFADMITAFDNPNLAKGYFDNLAKRLIPAGANTIARTLDPYEREATTTGEKMAQRIPGLRENLPKSYSLYSADPNNIEARKTSTSQAITGISVADMPTEFQQGMAELGVTFSPKSAKMSKVAMDSQQLSDYKRMINEMSTRMFANAMPNLQKLPNDKIKQTVARNMMSRVTKAARMKLLAKYPGLRDSIREQNLYDKYGIE